MNNKELKAETEVQQSDAAEVPTSSQTIAKPHVIGSPFLSSGRQIKFRGKDILDGAWCYGYLYVDHRDGKHWIVTSKNTNANMHMDEVIPESVGQSIGVNGYTGVYPARQRNQVELFEGDIVEAMSEGSKGTFVIKFREEGNPCWLLYPNWQSKKHWNISASNIGIKEKCLYDDLKLIGNVIDNPELLGCVQ